MFASFLHTKRISSYASTLLTLFINCPPKLNSVSKDAQVILCLIEIVIRFIKIHIEIQSVHNEYVVNNRLINCAKSPVKSDQ